MNKVKKPTKDISNISKEIDTKKPTEIKIEMFNPFLRAYIGKDTNTTQEDEYCTCTNCPHCGKKLRKMNTYNFGG